MPPSDVLLSLPPMGLLIDSFWRAALYCLYPRVIGLSLLPLVLIVAISWALGYFYWDSAVALVRGWLDSADLLTSLWAWLDGVGVSSLKTVVAPLLVILAVTPLVVVATLLAVTFFMTPSLAALVVERRFAGLQRQSGSGLVESVVWTVVSVLLALGALLLTLPLWLVPPLALLLPALIWGWLSYRVMTFDVLAGIASPAERRALMAQHRLRLLVMGVMTGLMGTAPSLIWASGALFVAAFVILVPLAIWIYTLVFAFSSLWFAHYTLAALHALRQQVPADANAATAMPLRPAPAAGASDGQVLDVQARLIESPHASERMGHSQDPKDHRHET